MTGKSKHSQA